MTSFSVVMPAFDELPNLRELIPAILAATESSGLVEVIPVLRSGAPQSEEDELRNLGARPIRRGPSDTFGDAMRSGLAAVSADSEFVVTMDADGSHDPATIPSLLAVAPTSHVVVASRYVAGGSSDNSLPLRLMSRALNRTYGVVLGIHCHDVSTNFKVYRREDVSGLVLTCQAFDVVEELLFRVRQRHGSDFVLTEVPDRFHERRHGTTKRQLGPFIAAYVGTLARLRWQASFGRTRVTTRD